MLKVVRAVPVPSECSEFCEYMGYKFLYTKFGSAIYEIPANEICKFNLNFESWKSGTFDKEKWLSRFND